MTGFQPLLRGQPVRAGRGRGGDAADAGPAARRGVARHRRQALLARAGVPSAVLLGLAALGLSVVMLAEALRLGTPIATADPDRAATLAVQRAAAVERRHPRARFALEGQVPGSTAPVRALVDRDTYLRAGPGALLSVAPTRDPANPWIALGMVERASPSLRLGDRGVLLLGVFVAALAPLGWYVLAVQPLRRAHPAMREVRRAQVTRTTLWVCAAGAAALLAGWLRGG